MPPIPGLVEAKPWGNREATTAKEAPESLVILGGGVVGVELAQAWASLGTQVILLEGRSARDRRARSRSPRPRSRRRCARRAWTCARTVAPSRSRATARSRSTMEDGTTATGAELLVAVGRKPDDREPGTRDDRARAGQAGRGRLEPALVQARLALRDRRRERPRAAHAHGQVPGAARRRLDPRPERDARLRRPALSARDLHRPAGGSGGTHAWLGGGGGNGGAGNRRRDGLDRGRELRRPRRARNLAARRSTTCDTSSPGRRSRASRSPRCCTRRRSPSSARCRSSGSPTPSRPSRRGARSG